MADIRVEPQHSVVIPQAPGATLPPPADRKYEYTTDPLQGPSLNDLRYVATDIKETLSAAIADLKIDICAVTARVNDIEKSAAQQNAALRHVNRKADTNTMLLRELHRQTEDLENRSRRHNLRVRGLPESIDFDQLSPAILGIFNDLLGRPPLTSIGMERLHRALRPRGKPTDPPRDVICHINDFLLKENILRNAKLRSNIRFEGSTIMIFQDLSKITLQNRRDLKPLLDVLRNNNIV